MSWIGPALQERIAAFLSQATEAKSVCIDEIRALSGGTLQENWLITARFAGGTHDGPQRLVLRTDAKTNIGMGHDRVTEFAILRAVHAAGILVPEPLWATPDRAIGGKPFFVMRWCSGSAASDRIVRGEMGGDGAALAERLGRELARIHAITARDGELLFLEPPPLDAAAARVAEHRDFLFALGEAFPVAQWAVRWLIRHAPSPVPPVLTHGDYRTGNYLVHEGGLSAILDWEFARWGDPDEDIAWFCSRCWRFGADTKEAGGIASRADFYRGYEAESGRRISPARVHYWEVMAALRRLIISIGQRDRVLVDGERSLNLALIGRRIAECELELLLLTEPSEPA